MLLLLDDDEAASSAASVAAAPLPAQHSVAGYREYLQRLTPEQQLVAAVNAARVVGHGGRGRGVGSLPPPLMVLVQCSVRRARTIAADKVGADW